jgi:hypothetical protein
MRLCYIMGMVWVAIMVEGVIWGTAIAVGVVTGVGGLGFMRCCLALWAYSRGVPCQTHCMAHPGVFMVHVHHCGGSGACFLGLCGHKTIPVYCRVCLQGAYTCHWLKTCCGALLCCRCCMGCCGCLGGHAGCCHSCRTISECYKIHLQDAYACHELETCSEALPHHIARHPEMHSETPEVHTSH